MRSGPRVSSALSITLIAFVSSSFVLTAPTHGGELARVGTPTQFERAAATARLREVSDYIRAGGARDLYGVDGSGLAVAVLDSGLRTTHVDFAGRVVAKRNFTEDSGGNPEDANDGNGHGTNVTGIIAANGDHKGIAPGAKIVALKVLDRNGMGSFLGVEEALQWVLDNHQTHRISVVNLSLGDRSNLSEAPSDPLREKIAALRAARIAVVCAAGNNFHIHRGRQGMSYPAVFAETVSVGAVYDADIGPFKYGSGAEAFSTAAGRLTPFSQRLHADTNALTHTDIFAPGAIVKSSGILNDHGESSHQGTSQAAPVIAGVLLLMQQHYLRARGELPSVARLEEWLREGGVRVHDGDDEDDNVKNAGKTFVRVDALSALEAMNLSTNDHFASPPTAEPNPATPNQPVRFSVTPGESVGVGAQVSWDFGDGAEGTGSVAQHAYAAPGTYTVRATVIGANGRQKSMSLEVVVAPVRPLHIIGLRLLARRSSPGRDEVKIAGTLSWPDITGPSDLTVLLNVGGAVRVLELDEKGRAKEADGTVFLRPMGGRHARETGRSFSFKARLKQGNWSDAWSKLGIRDADIRNATILVPVRLEVDGKVFVGSTDARYSARAGKDVRVKSVRTR